MGWILLGASPQSLIQSLQMSFMGQMNSTKLTPWPGLGPGPMLDLVPMVPIQAGLGTMLHMVLAPDQLQQVPPVACVPDLGLDLAWGKEVCGSDLALEVHHVLFIWPMNQSLTTHLAYRVR